MVLVEDVVDGSDHVLGHLVAGLARVELVLGVRGVHRAGDLRTDAAHSQGLLSETFLPKGKNFSSSTDLIDLLPKVEDKLCGESFNHFVNQQLN